MTVRKAFSFFSGFMVLLRLILTYFLSKLLKYFCRRLDITFKRSRKVLQVVSIKSQPV